MGLSFTISKKGKRYKPEPKPESKDQESDGDSEPETHIQNPNPNPNPTQGDPHIVGESSIQRKYAFTEYEIDPEDHEASFSVNLFANGFTIGQTKEFLDHVPENLLPYNRQTEDILSDIEFGKLPAGYFDDIPCNYINGHVICEIRDYRDAKEAPIVNKIALKMGMQNLIRDISAMDDGSFSYQDLLEFEARVVRYLQPHINLNPYPDLNALTSDIPMKKIDLRIDYGRKKSKIDNESNTKFVGSQAGTSSAYETQSFQPCVDLHNYQSQTAMWNVLERENCGPVVSAIAADRDIIMKDPEEEMAKQDAMAICDGEKSQKNKKRSTQKRKAPSTSKGPKGKKINAGKNCDLNPRSLMLPVAALNVVESLARSDNVIPLVTSDPVVDRFIKIDMLAKRHGLDKRNPEQCRFSRANANTTLLLEAIVREEEEYINEMNPDVSKARTFTFGCASCLFNANENQRVDEKVRNQLIMREKFGERMVDVFLIYRHNKNNNDNNSTNSVLAGIQWLQKIFLTSHEANLYAEQFISCMVHEGFAITGDVYCDYQEVDGHILLKFKSDTGKGQQKSQTWSFLKASHLETIGETFSDVSGTSGSSCDHDSAFYDEFISSILAIPETSKEDEGK